MGYVMTAIMCLVYNAYSKFLGGLQFTFVSEPASGPAPEAALVAAP